MNTEHYAEQVPSFWNWSVSAYDETGVADIMLGLQDEFGLNVNLVLWCLWAGQYFPGLDDQEVTDLLNSTQEWQKRVTIPLRNIRRDMKKITETLPKKEIKSLRREVKRLELQAERMEQNHIGDMTLTLAGQNQAATDKPCHIAYFDFYQTACGGLELVDGLGLEDQTKRVREQFLTARDLIFPEGMAQTNV